MSHTGSRGWVYRGLIVATGLALITIVFGAYVRLTDAGLGCPDWPGCYGRLVVPEAATELPAGDPNLAKRPLEQGKAWREMIHRYLASTLGLVIMILVFAHVISVAKKEQALRPTLVVLAPLVLFQGALGMWTVTLLLKPAVVLAHLLGGLSILALLVWNVLARHDTARAVPSSNRLSGFALLVLALLLGQIALGGWTSTNYAALACADFPRCHGSFWPPMDFKTGFTLWHGLGVNYEYGILDAPARIAIHFTHRIGAIVVSTAILAFVIALWLAGTPRLRTMAALVLAALVLQASLGILNVVLQLPLAVAVGHNFGAAALLVSLVCSLYYSRFS